MINLSNKTQKIKINMINKDVENVYNLNDTGRTEV